MTSNTSTVCRQCGFPTREGTLCLLCTADNLKGGPVVCKKCQKPCLPIGATLRGVQLVGCPSCGLVYADIPTVKVIRKPKLYMSEEDSREFIKAARKYAHPVPAKPAAKIVNKPVKITKKVTKKVVVKKTTTGTPKPKISKLHGEKKRGSPKNANVQKPKTVTLKGRKSVS